jgi:hypothetical protein
MQEDIVSRRVARFFAGWMICMGVLGGAAVGLAGIANASTGSGSTQTTGPTTSVRGPQVVATPNITAPRWVPPQHRVIVIPLETGGE